MANVNNQVYKKKSHPFLKFIIIFLIILLILVGLPVAFLYIFIYDGSRMNVWNDPNLTLNTYVEKYTKNVVSNSLDDSKETGEISFALSEGDVNTLLHYAVNESLSSNIKEYVTGANLDITKDRYNFYVNAETPFFPYFKTRVCLSAELKDLPAPDKGFEFKFVDAKIGKIGGLLSLADNFVTQDMVDNIFSGTKMNFEVDWANHSVKYKINSMLADFGLDSSGNDNIFFEIIKDLFNNNNDVIKTEYFANEAVEIKVDMSSAHKDGFVPVTDFANSIKAIRNEMVNTENLDNDTVTNRFNELIVELYEKPGQGKEISECLDDNKNEAARTTYITEDELNDYLRGTDLIGKCYPFIAQDLQTKKNKINFIVINDFFCDLKANNEVTFYINININGYDTQLTLDASIANAIAQNGEGQLTLDFTLSDIRYGNLVSLWDSSTNAPKQIVADMIKDGFKVDGTSSPVTIDGSKISIIISNAMYNLGNEITTTDNQMNVQVFIPQVFVGTDAVDLYSFPANLKEGDMYYNILENKLYTRGPSSWDAGVLIDDTWKASNPDLWNQISGLIPLP